MWRMRVVAVIAGWTIVSAAVAEESPVRAEYRAEQHQAAEQWIGEHGPAFLKVCKHLHANPELSLQEAKTSALVTKHLREAGYEVITGLGGHGVAGVLRNGDGPTIMVRGDMDALPIVEETGLDYASSVRAIRSDGSEVGVMHACGHDMHITTLIGTAQLLSDLRDRWRGTMLMVGQPAEEMGNGAQRMIEDGLFERCPVPDYIISLHVSHKLPVGQVACTPGWAAANVDAVDITIYGRGGHGARPNSAIDPIVTAAHVITQLQTIVSRRISPIEPGVITVGSIHGGTKHNVIPNEVHMQLTVRSYSDEVRKQLLDGIRQITTDVCRSFQCPKPPLVEIDEEYTPSCYNDPALTRAAMDVYREVFGPDNVVDMPAGMGGEDFGMYHRHIHKPALQISLGTVHPETYAASLEPGALPLPSLHSSKYVADMGPSVNAGIRSMSTLALSLLATP